MRLIIAGNNNVNQYFTMPNNIIVYFKFLFAITFHKINVESHLMYKPFLSLTLSM